MNADKLVSRERDRLNSSLSHRDICVHLRLSVAKIPFFLTTQPHPEPPREGPRTAHPHPAPKPGPTTPFKPSRIDPLNREPPVAFEPPRIESAGPDPAVSFESSRIDPLNREPPVPPTLRTKTARRQEKRVPAAAGRPIRAIRILAAWRFVLRPPRQRWMMQSPNAIALPNPGKNRSRTKLGSRRKNRPWNPPGPCPTIPRSWT
jgi:hypothetical protein